MCISIPSVRALVYKYAQHICGRPLNLPPAPVWVTQISHDQFTSFAKEPWGFNRPENLKEHSVLSKATFAEWPNTTSDFALRRGIAPTGKLAAHHKSRFESGNGREKVGTTCEEDAWWPVSHRDEKLLPAPCTAECC